MLAEGRRLFGDLRMAQPRFDLEFYKWGNLAIAPALEALHSTFRASVFPIGALTWL